MSSDTPNLDGLSGPDSRPLACPKGSSRLQDEKAERKLTVVNERDFKKEVWKRDQKRCRCCERKVITTLARVKERGEVHHLHGRTGDLRFEERCALLLCAECHEKVTGRVKEKWIAVGTKFWKLNGETVIDARKKVAFRRIA